MTRRRGLALALALACPAIIGAASVAPAAGAAPDGGSPPAVRVALDHARMSTRLGAGFGLGSTITNVGRRPLAGLIAHLNVIGLTNGVYVDPEDWSPQRTKNVPTLAPGQSARIAWRVNAVNGGQFAVYVVAVPRRSPRRTCGGRIRRRTRATCCGSSAPSRGCATGSRSGTWRRSSTTSATTPPPAANGSG